MDTFPSKPYTISDIAASQTPGDIDQMFRELYDAGSAMNSEISDLETGSGGGGVTIAQVMARVVLGI